MRFNDSTWPGSKTALNSMHAYLEIDALDCLDIQFMQCVSFIWERHGNAVHFRSLNDLRDGRGGDCGKGNARVNSVV